MTAETREETHARRLGENDSQPAGMADDGKRMKFQRDTSGVIGEREEEGAVRWEKTVCKEEAKVGRKTAR